MWIFAFFVSFVLLSCAFLFLGVDAYAKPQGDSGGGDGGGTTGPDSGGSGGSGSGDGGGTTRRRRAPCRRSGIA